MTTHRSKLNCLLAVVALLGWGLWAPPHDVEAAQNRGPSGRIAFGVLGKKPGLFIVGAATGESQRLTRRIDPAYQTAFDPEWSASGRRLLFAGDPAGDSVPGIFSIARNGSELERLSRAPCYADYAPDYSPDGSTILYRHDTCETARGYLMDRDGGNKRKITTFSTFDPIWSPDGEWIAFSGRNGGRVQVFVMRPDGEPKPVTTSLETGETSYENRDPDWAPDSSKLVYTGRINTREQSRNTAEVCVVNVDGTNDHCLTTADGNDEDPEFSPNGEQIVFVSHRDRKGEIYVMQADGSEQERLTSSPGSNYNPSWSPDGRWIAFVSTRSGNVDIYVIRSDGSEGRRLTRTGVREVDLAWAPL